MSDTINVKTICTDLNAIISFSGACVVRSLVFCVLFCRSLFVLLSFFFWPLCCLSFDLRFLITPVVSSCSFTNHNGKKADTLIVRDGKGRHGAAKSKHSGYMRYESHVDMVRQRVNTADI